MAFETGSSGSPGNTRFAIATKHTSTFLLFLLVRPIRPQPRIVLGCWTLDGGWMLQQGFEGALLTRTSVCRACLLLPRCRLVLVEGEGKDEEGSFPGVCPYSGTHAMNFRDPGRPCSAPWERL